MRTPDLSEVLARWQEDARTLRRIGGSEAVAAVLENCAGDVARSAEEWLSWLSESDAIMRSGHAASWLRARREEWKRAGHCRQVGRGKYTYRACCIPRRANVTDAAARGREAAKRAAA
jgi:hypothetical protein